MASAKLIPDEPQKSEHIWPQQTFPLWHRDVVLQC